MSESMKPSTAESGKAGGSDRAQRELERFFALAQDMLCIAGFDGFVRRISPACERIFGFTPEEVKAQPFLAFVHPEEHPKWLAELQNLASGGVSTGFESRARCRDGSYKWILWNAAADMTEGLVYAAGRDITERKEAERESRALLASIVQFSHDAIFARDLTGTILSWNKGAERQYGYSATEAVGRPVSILMPPDRADDFAEIMARIKRGENIEDFETERIRKDGRRVAVSLTISPLHDPEGRVTAASSIARDITERKRAEAEIKKLNEDLERRVLERTAELAAANQDLESFTYSVSHDLRAPLRHMDGFSRILIDEYAEKLDPEVRGYLERIRAGARQMGRLVDDLLKLARVGRHDLAREATDLGAIASEVVENLKNDVDGRVVEWKMGELPRVECDASLVKQVFQNLLSNALKYTGPRERAVIEVDRVTRDGEHVLFVRDNGVGFNMKYADKLFGVFQRLHRADEFEGTGVGLATVKRIVDKHGGRVWAEAEMGKGATFFFTLGPVGKDGTKIETR